MAAACVHVMQLEKARYQSATEPMKSHINVGTGQDVTIRELAEHVKAAVGYSGGIEFDASKPDGTPRKLLDVSLINRLGWEPRIALDEGLRRTCEWYCREQTTARG
jgi:GDP-L-fucose synthase